ncbi:MAG: hypothetical protein PUC94_07310 [Bacteroidales bacterium]|nr:hypothetical protein [Bacteroidales bacterium]MDD6723293.1 hypothetical protein [Bacteroidales bacterium]
MNFRLLIFILLGGLSMGCYAAPEGQGKIPEGGSAILTGSVPDTAAESSVPALDEIFPVLNDIPKNMVELQQLPANELPCEVVSRYLLQVKNANRFLKGFEIKYRAFGRFVYNSNVYLLYDMTNGVEHEVYLSLYPKKKSYPLTLKIYQDFNGDEIDFTIDKGNVTLNTYAIGSEDPIEQGLTYELNSSFTETAVSDWTWTTNRYTTTFVDTPLSWQTSLLKK